MKATKAAPAVRTMHYLPSVTIRLTGAAENRVVPRRDRDRAQVDVYIPGAIVILWDERAAWTMLTAWRNAAGIAERTFGARSAAGYEVANRHTSHITIGLQGKQSVEVFARNYLHSRSGCGELAVVVGPLTIVADDREAYDQQVATTWRVAAATANAVFDRKGRARRTE
ncbi:hypothetical protein C1I98_01425 [Spongiactinospora gelatinilytica]|uniref:Uncharacterized protein n=1 Tax=Spongiactinospora gelatinilytica TaxID=2666298 RepID=A0A2W2I039_9ACTN|nr:hypothetical protein [Spongiactinospora gelatinilytica]PZG56320.1 hypothetical protein C1I98_01425 [Spongiactinospora gelatinilytica]